MRIKTPQDIARETYGQEPGEGWAVGSSDIIPRLVAAIEADHAQRGAVADSEPGPADAVGTHEVMSSVKEGFELLHFQCCNPDHQEADAKIADALNGDTA